MVATQDVAHLCRRAGFGASASEITTLSAHPTISALVDAIVDDPRNISTLKPRPVAPRGNRDEGYRGYVRIVKLGRWYLERMSASRFAPTGTPTQVKYVPAPLLEKMTLFWHGLLVSSAQKPQNLSENFTLLDQHNLFRTHALGNFQTLLSDTSKDPAMLIYLDNALSTKDLVNENYGREVLELFSLGVGNYTQTDVIGASRAGTGYTLDSRAKYKFDAAIHDNTTKTFFGVDGNWDLTGAAATSGGLDVVPHLCTTKQVEVSTYLAKLLFQYFAHFTPSPATISDIATGFRQSGQLNIKDALKTIFNHPDFWSATARAGKMKTPPEWVAACGRALALKTLPRYGNGDDGISGATDQMGLFLFNQPSVFGWWRRPEPRWIGYPAFVAKVDAINSMAGQALSKGTHPVYTLGAMPTATAVDTVLGWFLVDPATAGATRTRAIEMLDRQRTEGVGDYWEHLNLIRFIALSPAVQVN
ncbi:MAG: DUF1800 family protein [Actinomycetota bacterium]|nr:DUF1800 family protein [Actinomycetota bacterium]